MISWVMKNDLDLHNFGINLNCTEAACQYCFLFIQNISFLKTWLLWTSALSSPLQTFAVSSQFQDAKLRGYYFILYSRFSSLLQRLSFDEFSLSVYGYVFKQFCGYFVFALPKKKQVKSLALSSALHCQNSWASSVLALSILLFADINSCLTLANISPNYFGQRYLINEVAGDNLS